MKAPDMLVEVVGYGFPGFPPAPEPAPESAKPGSEPADKMTTRQAFALQIYCARIAAGLRSAKDVAVFDADELLAELRK